MKAIPIIFSSLFCILLYSFTPIPNHSKSSDFCELVDLGSDMQIGLGESVELQLLLACPMESLESIVWEPMTYLDCEPELCVSPTILPLDDICYEVTVTSTDGTVGVADICIFIEDCSPEFAVNNINSISPQQIDDTAEITLELVQTQYTKIDLVDGSEVLHSIWEGWLSEGDRTIDLDFSAIPAGNYQLRVQLHPEDLFINIQKN